MSLVKLEIRDRIAIVTLDNPPVNALSAEGQVQIYETFDSLHEQDEAVVAIFTGAGQRAFCAGADIRARLDGDARFPEDHGRRAREAFNSIYECPIPVIGAINGPALGAGLALAASCDYLIASENANFALPEIDVGLMGGALGPPVVEHLPVGHGGALERREGEDALLGELPAQVDGLPFGRGRGHQCEEGL